MRRIRPSLTPRRDAVRARGVPAGGCPAAISYRTLFQDPGPSRTADFSLDNRMIELVNAAAPEREFASPSATSTPGPIADALIAAHLRHVGVDARPRAARRARSAPRP
jgi:hypothetical protein